ncbi:hypothetical protein DIS24_g1180 [Lasiodiplodia hormozganensis]|uniref:RNase H type-1 domain-containing protein n=1 Tax=Lasiodiplodia hormozganensis TaxID=869390 RepID=A0AA39Z3S4_9PEZI|nr:hypothetical protein DIS24_g1180 [Lasiodiplodia hormozganensis]
MPLKVHIDRLEGNKMDNDASIEFAQAAQPASVMTVYADGSYNEGKPGEAAKLGWAAVWKDPAAPMPEHWAHDEGSVVVEGARSERTHHSLIREAELRGLKTGLNNVLMWRPDAVDTVFVLTDSFAALTLVKSWVEGAAAGSDEPILVQMKYLAGRLHEQGVAVTLRWLKSRSRVDGHDVADVWARMASGAGPDMSHDYYARHYEVRLLVQQQANWEKKKNEALDGKFCANWIFLPFSQ